MIIAVGRKSIEVIGVNEFLRREFNFCWSCGGQEYLEFFAGKGFYRVCLKCLLTKPKLRKFLLKRMKEKEDLEAVVEK